MAIDWSRFTFLCNVDACENVHIYPTDTVTADIAVMKGEFRKAQNGGFLPSLRIIPADFGHKPGIAVFFSQRLKVPLLTIGATIDRIADKIVVEGMEPPVAKQGNPNEQTGRANHRPNDASGTRLPRQN